MIKLSVVLAATAFALVSVQAGAVSAAAASPVTDPPRAAAGEPGELTVTGRGNVQAVPDVMRLNVGVEVRRDRAGEAFAAVKAVSLKLTGALVSAGVAKGDLRTDDLSLGSEYEKYPKVIGYRATQGVEAVVHDLARVDAVLDAAAATGEEVRLGGVSFEVSQEAVLLAEARAAAYRDARAKAEQYAGLTGRQVGRVLKLDEEGDTSPSRFALAEKTSISPGRRTISVSVRVVYELV